MGFPHLPVPGGAPFDFLYLQLVHGRIPGRPHGLARFRAGNGEARPRASVKLKVSRTRCCNSLTDSVFANPSARVFRSISRVRSLISTTLISFVLSTSRAALSWMTKSLGSSSQLGIKGLPRFLADVQVEGPGHLFQFAVGLIQVEQEVVGINLFGRVDMVKQGLAAQLVGQELQLELALLEEIALDLALEFLLQGGAQLVVMLPVALGVTLSRGRELERAGLRG